MLGLSSLISPPKQSPKCITIDMPTLRLPGITSVGWGNTLVSRCIKYEASSNQTSYYYRYITHDESDGGKSAPHHHHHKPGFRARTAIAQEWLRTHGYRLAPVNPLRRDGLMASHVQEIENAFPSTLRPLVQPFIQSRLEDRADEDCLPPVLSGTDEIQVMATLLKQYCSGIGYEIMHCATDEERQFFIQAAESMSSNETLRPNDQDLLWCLEHLLRAGEWERLLSKRYPVSKRFSLEGLESGILALNTILETFATSNGTDRPQLKQVVLGTLHRGRCNLIQTVLQKRSSSLLDQWDATEGPTYDDINEGHSANIITKSGENLHVSLLSMPAHLESQDPAVKGKSYGHMVASMLLSERYSESIRLGETLDESVRHSVLPLMVHGDSSFCGQGIVSETLQLSTYTGFDCGGTVHVIFNNQVGFTAETQKMRTSRHSLVSVSDLALSIRAPVLHVNAERPRDVFLASRLATEYRQRFGKDVILDVWGYRKHGHNEMDEPHITNVSLYQEVDCHEPVAQMFADTLPDRLHQDCRQLQQRIEAEYRVSGAEEARDEKQELDDRSAENSKEGEWVDFMNHPSSSDGVTGVGLQEFKSALSTISNIPDGFKLPQPTQRTVLRRAELHERMGDTDETGPLSTVDWATAELLALSTLANEGYFCRLCGQDSQRGTFSQRHAVWHDAITGRIHYSLPPLVQVVDSPLSELGVLGFEQGFSLASPNFLALWEAQFGDFNNNCQTLIDTMIASEKDKFGLQSNLVLLLPHGYDGMGPEHSSSRLERYLTLHTDTPEAAEQTEDDLERFRNANFTVIYPSTPSNYFHVLRRSFSWPFRRPMIVLTPKRTLRLPKAASPVSEFLRNRCSQTSFQPVLDDPRTLDPGQVKSIVICSGEICYDVLQLVEDLPEDISQTVAIIRVEQLAPFPLLDLKKCVEHYPLVQRAVHVQEEPRNMGALRFAAPFVERIGVQISVPISRPVSASPAVGNPRDHQASQLALLSRIADWIQQQSKTA